MTKLAVLGTVTMSLEQYVRIPEKDRPLVWQTLMERAGMWPGFPIPYFHEPTQTHYMVVLGEQTSPDALPKEKVMAVSKERKKAQKRADFAVWANGRIAALPPKNGSRVLWDNGIVWTRIGDDHWENVEGLPGEAYSSEHIATIGDWTPLSKREYERMYPNRTSI